MHVITDDMTIPYKRYFASVNLIEQYLTVLSPNIDDQRMKIEWKTLTLMDIFFVQARKSPMETKRLLDAGGDDPYVSWTMVYKWH